MLNEIRGLEYTLEILRVLHLHPGENGSKRVYELVAGDARIAASLSYIQKVLQRMVKANLLKSSEHGYQLSRPLNELTMDMVLDICDLPNKTSPTYALCMQIKRSVAQCNISQFYDFDKPPVADTPPEAQCLNS